MINDRPGLDTYMALNLVSSSIQSGESEFDQPQSLAENRRIVLVLDIS